MATFGLARRAALQVLPLWLAAPALNPLPSHAAEAPTMAGYQTRSGLKYIDFREGVGESPRFGQLIRFHYVGYTIEGSRLSAFDSSYERNKPYFTKHGNGLTCQGIEEALHTMAKGGRRRVVLPAPLGFTGDKGPLPPKADSRAQMFAAVSQGSPLVFDLELVGVMDDLLDRGYYNDLSLEEAADLAKQKEEERQSKLEGESQFGRGVV
jgi:hypothetical protein